jgi:uncharacterized oligopeptide transporter (OPT) family protein
MNFLVFLQISGYAAIVVAVLFIIRVLCSKSLADVKAGAVVLALLLASLALALAELAGDCVKHDQTCHTPRSSWTLTLQRR